MALGLSRATLLAPNLEVSFYAVVTDEDPKGSGMRQDQVYSLNAS